MIFSPAIALMNRLGYAKKFAVLGLMSLVAIVVVVYSLYLHLDEDIRTAQQELQGIALIKPFSRTIQLIQQHRGLSAGLLGGDKTIWDRRAAKAREAAEAFKEMEGKLSPRLASSEDLLHIKANWERIREEGLNWTKDENFAAHTSLIDQLRLFEVVAADEYALTLDQDIDTYYLIDTTIQRLPHALEHLAQIRGYGTGLLAQKQATGDQKVKINTMIAELGDALKLLKINLKKADLYNPAMHIPISAASDDIDDATRKIIDIVALDILTGHFATAPYDFFEMTTVAIDKNYTQLYDSLLPMCETLLKARIARAENALYTSVGIALILFLVVVYFSTGICYAIIGNIRSLARSAHAFAGGDLRERVRLGTRDELNQVGDSFNEMADGFSTLLEARREDDARLHVTIETAMDAVVRMDAGGIIIGWNSQAEKTFGWSRQEAVGRVLSETIIPPRYREAHVQGMKRFLLTGEGTVLNSRIEIVGLHRDGREFPIELSIAPTKIAGKYEFSAFIRDITERKQAGTKLTASELRYRRLFESAKDGILILDAETGMIEDVNPFLIEMLGYSHEEFLGKRIWELGFFKDILANRDNFVELQQQEYIRYEDLPLEAADGRVFHVEFVINVYRVDGGKVVQCNIRDISERKQAEAQRWESEARYKRITEGLTDYQYTVIVENGHAVKAMHSEGCVTVTGYAAEEFAADPNLWIQLVAPQDRDRVGEYAQQILAGKDIPPIEYRIIRKDGEVHWVSDTTILFKDASGKLQLYDGVIKDITESKAAEEQIQRYVAQLESAFMRTVEVTVTLTEMRDPYTAGHERRVAEIAAAIGGELGWDARRLEGLRVAGQLHDVGKISLPAEILAKPGRITAAEYTLIKEHAKAGYDALKDVGFPWPVAEVAWQHHERMDGSGYPRGLKGEEIMFEARIMSVADVVEAMASHRPYRPGHGIDKALEEIERGRGTAFDAAVAEACLRLFREKGYALPA
jgi:PAS domain S-box-containing protein